MARFTVSIDADATWICEIEADTQEEAYEKAEAMIDEDDFFERYRQECDFIGPRVYYNN